MMEKTLNKAIEILQDKFSLTKLEDNIYRLNTPFFHRINGDPYNIFIDSTDSMTVLTDRGETIDRLQNMVDTTKNYTIHKVTSIVEKYGCTVQDEDIIINIEDINHLDMYLNMYIHALICVEGLFE